MESNELKYAPYRESYGTYEKIEIVPLFKARQKIIATSSDK
jgi:hypothetical protein